MCIHITKDGKTIIEPCPSSPPPTEEEIAAAKKLLEIAMEERNE